MDSDIHPIKLTKNLREKHVNLLVTSNENTNHYILIKDFIKFCYTITKFHGKKHFCMKCIQHFSTEKIWQSHIPECMAINNV